MLRAPQRYFFLHYLFANPVNISLKSGIWVIQKCFVQAFFLLHLFKNGWIILLSISGTNNSDLALSMAHKTCEQRIKEMVIHQTTEGKGKRLPNYSSSLR